MEKNMKKKTKNKTKQKSPLGGRWMVEGGAGERLFP